MTIDASPDADGLTRLTLNADGDVAPLQPPRAFYVRTGNDADADVIREVFEEFAYDVARSLGGEFNAARLGARYARILADGKVPLIVDAGAMIGASAVFYQLVYPESFVVAVEPERTNFAILERNCRGLDIRPVAGAIASEAGSLFVSDPGNGHFGFRTGGSGFVEVPAFAIRDVLADFDPARYEPFVCKVNIEGGEADLFSRNVEWLDAFAAVAIELHDWMLPGSAVSRSFLAAVAARNFDFTYRGYCATCFNNDVLAEPEPEAKDLAALSLRSEPALGHVDGTMVTGFGDGHRVTTPPFELPPGSVLHVEGWAADPAARSAGSGLVARVGTLRLDVTNGYGAFRDDVAAALGGAAFRRSGFDVEIEASALPEGPLELELAVIGADGRSMFALPDRVLLHVRAR